MDDSIYKSIIQESSFGYTYNELVFDKSGIPVDYIFRDVNSAFASFLGTTKIDLIDKRVSEILTDFSTDSFNWLEHFSSVSLSGTPTSFDAFSQSLNRYFHFTVSSPARGFFVVISFDITTSKAMEKEIAQKEEERKQYFDNAPDGIFIANKEFQYIEINEAACKMTGYPREELLSLHIFDLIPLGNNSVFNIIFEELNSKQKSRQIVKLKRKNGSLISVIIDVVKMKDGKFLALCKDISEHEKLEKEKEQYYLAFQSISQPVLITDSKGIIISVNDAFVDMYGYSREELLGKNPHMLNPGKEVYENLGVNVFEYDSLFRDLWQSVNNPSVRVWKGDLINRKKNTSLVWINLIINALYDNDNNLVSIVGLPIDMTVSHEEALSNRIQLFQTIADLAELRDDETGNHMRRVGLFAKLLARELGMKEKYCNDIEIFAPMHDIGKVGILDSILLAPRKLTPEEFEIMKTHTTLGHNIVKGKAEFEMAAAITLCHHERFDGTGYPNGLSGKHIPQSAQITAISDVYDALRSKRSYKEPWSHEKAIAQIVASSGTHFDPDIVQHFLHLEERFKKIFKELADDRDLKIVSEL
ncbi:MAG TPA: PAS domain-containing protein [Treponemataceae bacterium]|nr:PAS domain-containing protein [Treponemataceae bacterium]